MSPPERALMLSCDEKSQIQALGRTQPGLPMKHARRHRGARLQAQWHDDPQQRRAALHPGVQDLPQRQVGRGDEGTQGRDGRVHPAGRDRCSRTFDDEIAGAVSGRGRAACSGLIRHRAVATRSARAGARTGH